MTRDVPAESQNKRDIVIHHAMLVLPLVAKWSLLHFDMFMSQFDYFEKNYIDKENYIKDVTAVIVYCKYFFLF